MSGRRRTTPRRVGVAAALLATVLAGHAVGPDYVEPDVPVGDRFAADGAAFAVGEEPAAGGGTHPASASGD